MPRLERFGLGIVIENKFLLLLDTLRKATYTDISRKTNLLGEAIDLIDGLRFFLQLSWEAKNISNNNLSTIGAGIEEIGRMVGGWRRGLLAKTSATMAEER